MINTVNNGIPFAPENTIDPAAGLNESLLTVDALLQLAVVSVGDNAPPGSPANGARYVVGTAPTGAWAAGAGAVAQFLDGAWRFYAARYVLNMADGLMYVRQGATWAVAPAEWTAETVSQAEAEAGTATTRRAWTAQRVAQAVRAALLTGLSTASASVITATDSVLSALGKLQAQITGLATSKLDATANAVSASKLQTARTIGGVAFDGTANINLPGVNTAGNQNTTGSAATLTTDRTLTIGNTGKTFNGSASVSWTLAEIGAVTSSVDTTPGRLLTTDYLDIGKLDKTLWPKATSLLTLKNGPDRTVWVETGTADAPNPGFYGKITCQRLSSTTVIMEAKPLFESARYIYTFTPLGDSGWVKETIHEVGDWVDLRPYLLSPFFWKAARDGNNHFPQARLVDRNTVELRGVVSFNASSAAPPNGVAFRVPEGFRPQMTSAGICFADSSSPLWFGQTAYLIQGQVNYSSNPGWANGNVRLMLLSAPNPTADGAVDLIGIRYYLS